MAQRAMQQQQQQEQAQRAQQEFIEQTISNQRNAINGLTSGIETKDELLKIYRAQIIDSQNNIKKLQEQVTSLSISLEGQRNQTLQAQAQLSQVQHPLQEPSVPITNIAPTKVEVVGE